jgi:LysM repeat protein
VIRGHARAARYGAPVAFLLAVTIAVLLVRSGLSDGSEATTPATTKAGTTAATTQRGTTTGKTTGTGGAEFYVIQSGDTLAVIADRYDTTVEQLLVLNPDVDPVALTVGDRIRVK